MRWFLFMVAAVLVVFVQTSWLGRLGAVAASADITLLFAIYLGMHSFEARTLLACWLLGLMRDVFATTPLGFWATVFLVVCAAAGGAGKRFLVRATWVQVSVAFAGALAAGIAVLAVSGGWRWPQLGSCAVKVLWSSALTALVSLPFFRILRAARFAVGLVDRR